MNQQTRIEKISQIIARDIDKPHGRQDIPWEDSLVAMPVYLIPLDYLVYNKYNGRILSRTKSLERQNHTINVETDEGKKLIEGLLYNTNIVRNKQTLDSLKKIGQEKVGIITKDGIIIDGNRRAMLLNMAGKNFLKAVVLDATLEENPLEIEKLETSFQMGEDEKLGYNPTEKYLKAKQLLARGVTVANIANWMGETEATVKDYLKVMDVMDEYLEYLDLNGIYTQLDGREDQFITLANQLATFYDKSSGKGFDGYKNSDVDDLKFISYDYIRVRYEGKDFRNIGYGVRESHFFGNKDIWSSFKDCHYRNLELISNRESKIDFDSENLKAHLDARDSQFLKLTAEATGKSFLKENLEDHIRKLNNIKYASQPIKLVNNAFDALLAIDQKHKASDNAAVLNQIQKITKLTSKMMIDKSPKRILSEIADSLELLDLDNLSEDKDAVLEQIKKIERTAYKLEKDLKALK